MDSILLLCADICRLFLFFFVGCVAWWGPADWLVVDCHNCVVHCLLPGAWWLHTLADAVLPHLHCSSAPCPILLCCHCLIMFITFLVTLPPHRSWAGWVVNAGTRKNLDLETHWGQQTRPFAK
jgi:hypothetical protein